MPLRTVTITGADDSTSIPALLDLSKEFPFVEWGILISHQSVGDFRFPSFSWIERLVACAPLEINLSTHMCGRWVRQLLCGELEWRDLPVIAMASRRVQINTHGKPHVSTLQMMSALKDHYKQQFIFQWDGVNDHLAMAARGFNLNVSALFDTSGGAGILPKSWPKPHPEIPMGYAGGLGPENVSTEIEKIEAVCSKDYWIDMERRVRSADDSCLDLDAVRTVLLKAAPWVHK